MLLSTELKWMQIVEKIGTLSVGVERWATVWYHQSCVKLGRLLVVRDVQRHENSVFLVTFPSGLQAFQSNIIVR